MNKYEDEMTKQHLDAALADGAGLVRAVEAQDWEGLAASMEALTVHELQAHVVALASLVGSAHGAGAAGATLGGFLAGTVEHARGGRA